MGRTFAIGDIHGDIEALNRLLKRLPKLQSDDTLLFIGDYIDRGPSSREVVKRIRELPSRTKAHVVALRGNHEDAWLQVVDSGWPEFVMPRKNGCYEAMRSFKRQPVPAEDEVPTNEEFRELLTGTFFPKDVVDWMRSLPYFHEDDHAIYVHAGLKRPDREGPFPHPRDVEPKRSLLWVRDQDFFRNYRGKTIVFGHTTTEQLPAELSSYTADDPTDLWAGPCAVGLDTGAGKGGFLTAFELPEGNVYESR
ncbi:MAG: serine/threonine protein phosphatase [Polyangiaceae bacterium]|nr:serine/threonine protein phosphatase [Polyangiaceae bacterium]